MPKRNRFAADYRAILAQRFDEDGFTVMPCSRCASRDLECRMLPGSTDPMLEPSDFEALLDAALGPVDQDSGGGSLVASQGS